MTQKQYTAEEQQSLEMLADVIYSQFKRLYDSGELEGVIKKCKKEKSKKKS